MSATWWLFHIATGKIDNPLGPYESFRHAQQMKVTRLHHAYWTVCLTADGRWYCFELQGTGEEVMRGGI